MTKLKNTTEGSTADWIKLRKGKVSSKTGQCISPKSEQKQKKLMIKVKIV